MEKRLSGHTAYKTEYHVVWVTKCRRPILNSTRRKYLTQLFPKILANIPGCDVVDYNILRDHVHMVIIIPPKYSVSKVVGRIKGRTSSYLRKRFTRLSKVYWKSNSIWTSGYYVSTVGVSESEILSYINNQ